MQVIKMELDELVKMLERINDFLRRSRKINLTQEEHGIAAALLRNNIDVRRLLWQLRLVDVALRGLSI